MAVRCQLNQPLPSQPFAQGGSKPLTATSAAHQSTRTVLSEQLLHPRVHQSFRYRDDLREHHHVPYQQPPLLNAPARGIWTPPARSRHQLL
jgi:hypothetical protein